LGLFNIPDILSVTGPYQSILNPPIKVVKYKPPLPASYFKKEAETSPLIEVTIPALSGPDQGKPWVGVLRKLAEAGYYN